MMSKKTAFAAKTPSTPGNKSLLSFVFLGVLGVLAAKNRFLK
jgi:hypothetical protein